MTLHAPAALRTPDPEASAPAGHRIAIVRLAMGAELGRNWSDREWQSLLECATRERCASLVWLRSAHVVRSRAPAPVAARWRAEALGAGELAAAQIEEMGELIRHLEAAGATPLVMKGHPLALLAYGDPCARPSFDIDLFIPLEQRPLAHRALLDSGWQHLEGDAPAEGTYRRLTPSRSPHLEVHSSLLDDVLLAHLPTPTPEGVRIDIGEHRIPAHHGDSLAAFLAAHLAKHDGVPLLWWLDFTALWNSLDAAGRERVRAAAGHYGLAGFLDWARRGVSLVERVATGSDSEATVALASLDAMHRGRNAFRVARLAPGARARARVIMRWLLPPDVRRSPRASVRLTIRRILRRVIRPTRPPTSRKQVDTPSSARVLEVSPTALASFLREATSAGGSTWIKVRGTSMLPTIPRIAEVRVDPIPRTGLQRGDVALVERPGAGLVMHRVVGIRGDSVELKGDNRFEADPPARLESVIGVAGEVRVGEQSVPVRRTPARSLRFSVARLHTYLRRRVLSA